MRQAADILSSAPAMQIRYLEAMQAMAKSANSKVIFLPGSSSQSLNAAMAAQHSSEATGAGGAGHDGHAQYDFGGQDPGLQQAINARVVETL